MNMVSQQNIELAKIYKGLHQLIKRERLKIMSMIQTIDEEKIRLLHKILGTAFLSVMKMMSSDQIKNNARNLNCGNCGFSK